MFYVYVLQSFKDLKFYFGMTGDLPKRLKKHQSGGVPSTKHRRPLEMVYYENCQTRLEARQREKFLKSGPGHKYLTCILNKKRSIQLTNCPLQSEIERASTSSR